MKFLMLTLVVLVSGCGSICDSYCEAEKYISREVPNKNVRVIPKYWSI